MKIYRVSNAGKVGNITIIAILASLFVFTSRKAAGLWSGLTAKQTDLILFGLDMNTIVPAFLLSLIALAVIPVVWHLLVEIITRVEVTENGIGVKAPGYIMYYRWDEMLEIDVMVGLQEDTTAELQISTLEQERTLNIESGNKKAEATSGGDTFPAGKVDFREDKEIRRQERKARKALLAKIRARATSSDGKALPHWKRLLYPQALRPDRILLYPALANRVALLAEIKEYFSGNNTADGKTGLQNG